MDCHLRVAVLAYCIRELATCLTCYIYAANSSLKNEPSDELILTDSRTATATILQNAHAGRRSMFASLARQSRNAYIAPCPNEDCLGENCRISTKSNLAGWGLQQYSFADTRGILFHPISSVYTGETSRELLTADASRFTVSGY